MPLKMPTPIKDKSSGIYYIRLRVPAEIVHAVGKREVSKSLRTRDPAEAKERFAQEYARYQRRWEAYRNRPQPLPFKEIVRLSGKVYHDLMTTLEDEPGEPEVWKQVRRLNSEAEKDEEALEQWYGTMVDDLLLDEGVATDATSRKRLLQEVVKAWQQATLQQLKRSLGDFSPDPDAARFPVREPNKQTQRRKPPVTISTLFEAWKRDHRANGKPEATIADFAQKLSALKAYLGHEDVARVDARDISEWVDHLRHEKGLTAKTVSGKYLAAVKTVFHLARSKFLISNDPSQDVSVRVPKKVKTRSDGFTEDEARQVLRAANRVFEQLPNMSHYNKTACRWVPWICAYTGARGGEATQLRTEDLFFDQDIPLLNITPEAGTVKAGLYRTVPIHPHLQEIGLIQFIKDAKPGYLFHKGGGTAEDVLRLSGNARDKVAKWVRDTVGIVDSRVKPNHAWRHRFKTVGRNADIEPVYLDAIQGHSGRTAGEDYGDFPAATLFREICKLPRIEVD